MTENKMTKTRDYSKSAENLCNPQEVEIALTVYRSVIKEEVSYAYLIR